MRVNCERVYTRYGYVPCIDRYTQLMPCAMGACIVYYIPKKVKHFDFKWYVFVRVTFIIKKMIFSLRLSIRKVNSPNHLNRTRKTLKIEPKESEM